MDPVHSVKSLWQNRAAKKALLAALMATILFAGAVTAGGMAGTAGAYLRVPVGATAFGMGGANSAEPTYLCQWWNPAALADLKIKQLTIGTGYRAFGRADGFAGWEFRVPPRVAMGFTLLYRGDPFLNNLYDEQEYRLDNGSFTTLTAKVGFSYMINRKMSAGANISMFYLRMPVGYDGKKLIYSGGVSDIAIGGFDLALRYKPTPTLAFALVVKNLGAGAKVRTASDYMYDIEIENNFPPVIVIGSHWATTLRDKPFLWSCDLVGYPLNADFSPADRPQVVLNNGFEWRGWEKFWLRAGLGDIAFTSDLANDNQRYRNTFSLSVTAGCHIDLSSKLKGLGLNYGLATNKVWRGMEQQLDCTYLF
jgi:hypothetical protein